MPAYKITTGDGETHTVTAPNIHVLKDVILFVKGPTANSEVVALFPIAELLSVFAEDQS